MIGETGSEALAVTDVPTSAIKPGSEYHFHVAPVPKVPPDWVITELLPLQIDGLDAFNVTGATDD